jgi:hypothetical protein
MKTRLVVLERRGVFRDLLVVILAGLIAHPVTEWVGNDPKYTHSWASLAGLFICVQVMATMGYHGLRFFAVQFHEEWFIPTMDGMRREARELEAAETSDKRGALTMKDET